MSVLIGENHRGEKEIIATCDCGCDEGVRIIIEPEDDEYCYIEYLSGIWFKQQTLKEKLKKIWKIIRGKDYYYAEIFIHREDYSKFKQYINQFGD